MNKILLLVSFIGAGYAANCENLPPSLLKSLTDAGKNGAQYVLVVNKYDAQAGYYADVWAFNGKELKHANHIKNVDVAKVIGSGASLKSDRKATKNIADSQNTLKNDKSAETKELISKVKDKSRKKVDNQENKDKSKKILTEKTKKEVKKELIAAKENFKKTGEAITKAKTKKAKQEAQAAHARAGKALIKAENAVK
jgi:hypothetical protein